MKKNSIMKAVIIALLLILSIKLAAAQQFYSIPTSYYGANAQYYFSAVPSAECDKSQGQDFVAEILPGACSPAVVRSDLLEEQRVPVFCKLTGFKVNPLIEVPYIRTVGIAGQYPKEIETVIFHPYQAALRTTPFTELTGSPTFNDLGYVVVVLKPNPVEREMPKEIVANLTARITYDLTSSFGIGKSYLVLPQVTNDEWEGYKYRESGFWYGKGYARALSVGEDSAQIGIYFDPKRPPVATFTLKKGELSSMVYLPGMYCSAGLQVKLEDVVFPGTRAVLTIDGDKVEAFGKGRILDDRCTVEGIEKSYGFGGRATINCPEGSYSLEKKNIKAMINVEGREESKIAGEEIDVKGAKYSILFLGSIIYKEGGKGEDKKNILVAGKGPFTEKEVRGLNDKIKDYMTKRDFTDFKNKLEGVVKAAIGDKGILIINSGKIDGVDITVRTEGMSEAIYANIAEKYYKLARDNYKEVAKNWPSITQNEGGGEVLGEVALLKAADMAEYLKKNEDAARILEEFLERYPDSKKADDAKRKIMKLSTSAVDDSGKVISTGGKAHYISLEDIREPTEEELGAVLMVNGKQAPFKRGDIIETSDWEIDKIESSSVSFRKIGATEKGISPVTIQKDEKKNLEKDVEVKVIGIKMKRYAAVSIKPYSREGETYANFTIHIGIEKRAIQLSPEQTKNLITKLDKIISDWGGITDKLRKVVTSWKKVCLVGSAAIWVENFFENLASGGEAMARQMAMRDMDIVETAADGVTKITYKGWAEWCGNERNMKSVEAQTVSECLFKKSSDINSDVKRISSNIYETNKLVEKVMGEEGVVKKSGLFGTRRITDDARYAEVMQKRINADSALSRLRGVDVQRLMNEGWITKSDLRDAIFKAKMLEDCQGALCAGLENSLDDTLKAYSGFLNRPTATQAQSLYNQITGKEGAIGVLVGERAKGLSAPINKGKEIKGLDKDQEQSFALIYSPLSGASGTYAIPVISTGANSYAVASGDIYKRNANGGFEKADDTESKFFRSSIGIIESSQPAEKCNYPYPNPEVSFWDSGPVKGYPAIMPLGSFAASSGWYAATESSGAVLQSGITKSEAFTEAGEPSHFWICNVGPNGVPDFGKLGDNDICQKFDLTETYKGQTRLCGLDEKEVSSLVQRAKACMKEAAVQYGKGKQILTQCGPPFKVGQAKGAAPQMMCEDFMSPEKCTLLYNLCDPVICPPSRCDFGGAFPTDNVIQTGIIGSLMLCFPNRGNPLTDGGVAVPICLTGVHAGLENLISLLKDVRKCLQENLDTGRNIGICDELKSVYLCEFFWREMTPFIKVGIPQLIERTIYGRRGGGEYLTFAGTWENSIKQFDYVTQYYGANALRAFQVRSTAEAGSMICRTFWGVRYPDQADLFEDMAKPESPPQINAWFDETSYSSVTIPPISHYKIYWHIFAGKDEPAYWTVYLKEPPLYSGAALSEMQVIKSGYLPAGGTSDETPDVTLPSGYKQLCVRINFKDYCGFKKVTTGFGIEELTSIYIRNQTVPDFQVSSAEECTSGSSALFTGQDLPSTLIPIITQPGMGAIEEAIQPEIWRRGIIRICSTENPSKGSNEARWKGIGFCDDQKKIRCWLDTESVKAAIKDLSIQNATLSAAAAAANTLLGQMTNYKNDEQSAKELKEARDGLDAIKTQISNLVITRLEPDLEKDIQAILSSEAVTKLKGLVQYSISPQYKARAQMALTGIYENIARKLIEMPMAKPEAAKAAAAAAAVTNCNAAKKYEAKIKELLGYKQKPTWLSGGINYDKAALIEALIMRESSGVENAQAGTGKTDSGMKTACGLMQLTPATAGLTGDDCGQLLTAEGNLGKGIPLFERYVTKFNYKDVTIKFAIAAWHAGENAEELIKNNRWEDASKAFGETKDVLGTRTVDFVAEVLRIYSLCSKPATEAAEAEKKNYLLYYPETAENVADVVRKFYSPLGYIEAKIQNEIRQAVFAANNWAADKKDVGKGDNVIIPFSETDYRDFTEGRALNCGGIFKISATQATDLEECHKVNLVIKEQTATPEMCYYVKGFLGTRMASECISCSVMAKCDDLNGDEKRCNNVACTRKIGFCEYKGGKCVKKDIEKEAEQLYQKALTGTRGKPDYDRAVAFSAIVKDYPGTNEAKLALQVMLSLAERSGDARIYLLIAEFKKLGLERISLSLYNTATEYGEIAMAIEAFDALNRSLGECFGSKEDYCKCKDFREALNKFSKATDVYGVYQIILLNKAVLLKRSAEGKEKIIKKSNVAYSAYCALREFSKKDYRDAASREAYFIGAISNINQNIIISPTSDYKLAFKNKGKMCFSAILLSAEDQEMFDDLFKC